MRHQNSVFHSLTKHIPWTRFDQIVEKYGADEFARKLTTKRQFIALLYGQLSGSTSLREVVTGMASHETRLYHVGATPVKRSTMSDANSKRPWQVFSELFAQMLPQAHRGLRRTTADAVRLIDSTSVRLSSLSEGWATFSTDVFGAKVHIVYDPNADRPVYFAVTPARVNDITAAKAMPIEPGATYVYDLGYYDYGWWAGLDEAGCRFVTRLKKNTPFRVVEENRVPKNSNIVSDRIGHLPARLANSRKNPLQVPVREVGVIIESGRQLRIVTNDLDAPAEQIAELYKQRWQIELFFRWVKQTLRIRHFIGVSENAVRYSDRYRTDRVSHLAHGPASSKSGTQPPRICPPRPHQPHAQTPAQPFARTSTADPDPCRSVEIWTILPMNRTAVGLSRASTS